MRCRSGRWARVRGLAAVLVVLAPVALVLGALGPTWWGLVVAGVVAWSALGLGLAWMVGGAASLRDRNVHGLGLPREATPSGGC